MQNTTLSPHLVEDAMPSGHKTSDHFAQAEQNSAPAERSVADKNFAGHGHTGHRVAIIGAGPTGLRAAYGLIRRGHSVALFDALPLVGGALADAVPATRFPRALLTHDMKLLQELGSDFRFQTTIGRDRSLSELLATFDAVLLAVGTQRSRHLHVSGETLLHGILPARRFLRALSVNPSITLGQNVVVIGGDRTAVFAARAALEAGAQSVQIAYAGTREMMTASGEEVEAALQDGIQLQEWLMPRSFIGTEEATLHAVRFYRTALLTSQPSSFPARILGTSVVMPADMILVAAGERPDLSFLPTDVLPQGLFPDEKFENNNAQATPLAKLFVAGGVLYGPGTIAQAMRHGEQAARMIDAFLRAVPLAAVPELPDEELSIASASLSV